VICQRCGHQLHPEKNAVAAIEPDEGKEEEEKRGYGQCSAMRLTRFLRGAISRLKIGLRYHACKSFFSRRGTEKERERGEGSR